MTRTRLPPFYRGQIEGVIAYVLRKLGKLTNQNSEQPLLSLLDHKNETIRTIAIQNLAKFGDITFLTVLAEHAQNEQFTEARCEFIFAIGRLGNQKTIQIRIDMLSDKDPKVILQAVRSLLKLQHRLEVNSAIIKLLEDPNELIEEFVNSKFN